MTNKYIVINACSGPARSPCVHETLSSAQREAARLAQSERNTKFYVLQVVGYMVNKSATWESNGVPDYSDDLMSDCMRTRFMSDDEIPF